MSIASVLVYPTFCMPDFGLEGVSSILAEITSTFFTFFSILIISCTAVRNPDSTVNKHIKQVQGACYKPGGCNAIHGCRPPAEQEATSRVCG